MQRSLALALLGALGAMATASASTVPLTGGDSTDGLDLHNGTGVVLAQTVNGASGITIQNVLFNSAFNGASETYAVGQPVVFTPNSINPNATTYPSFGSPTGYSGDDTSLLSLINTGVAYGPAPGEQPAGNPSENFITMTISGLTPGATYTVDALTSTDGYGNHGAVDSSSGRSESIFYDGGSGGSTFLDTPTILNENVYDTHGSVKVGTAGTIVVSFAGVGPTPFNGGRGNDNNDGAIAQAIIISVPEPATFSLIGLGCVGFLARQRKA